MLSRYSPGQCLANTTFITFIREEQYPDHYRICIKSSARCGPKPVLIPEAGGVVVSDHLGGGRGVPCLTPGEEIRCQEEAGRLPQLTRLHSLAEETGEREISEDSKSKQVYCGIKNILNKKI